ncbi:MAG TPA: phosphoglycerate kinase [Candidatus Gastranaerophilaceae bacterium]|nr:phosphoglycerate kinase [Candidatus Gastranaerophilaceae bacterium]HPT40954.1 phosphoglycerate kinase [Candidatus Gastranaerophilaceae bacterium]
MKKSIKDLGDIKGKRALVRVDVNVPLDENKNVTDDTRIQAIIPTIKFLQEKGAKIILMAHLGRPKGEWNMEFTLAPVAKKLSKVLGQEVLFISTPIGQGAEKDLTELKDGQVALLENIRFYKAEEAKDDDMTFAKELAKLGDFYVNDAFGAAHRNHTSTSKLAKVLKPAVSGFLMEKEIRCLGNALNNPVKPFTAIVGGAKVSTKIGVLENLIDKVDNLIIGGGMAYTFVKANGGKIGNSICEDDQLEVAKEVEKKAAAKGVKIIMAKDVLVTDDFSGNGTNKIVDVYEIPDGFEGVDAGPETQKAFEAVIKTSKTILWNGPVGAFENDKFTQGTKAVALAVQEATKNGAVSVLGGGDTVAAVKKYKLDENTFTHISTGGGASLEFIEGKVLPGVDALDDK